MYTQLAMKALNITVVGEPCDDTDDRPEAERIKYHMHLIRVYEKAIGHISSGHVQKAKQVLRAADMPTEDFNFLVELVATTPPDEKGNK